jgi:hypothetical protein
MCAKVSILPLFDNFRLYFGTGPTVVLKKKSIHSFTVNVRNNYKDISLNMFLKMHMKM